MFPELVGGIKSYGLTLAISFALGLWLSIVRARQYKLSSETVMDLVFAVLVSSVIGVRLAFVLTHLSRFDKWYEAFYIWDGGLTLYGGIGLATATVWYLCKRRKIPFLVMADIFSPGVILGIGITRIGCFLAGCCYGTPASCAWAIKFPTDAPASIAYGHVHVHPAQLYGSMGGFLTFVILLLWERWSNSRGGTFGRFLILYGLSRFVNDFFRYYEPEQVMAFGWSNNQWVSIVLIIVGAITWYTMRKTSHLDGYRSAA